MARIGSVIGKRLAAQMAVLAGCSISLSLAMMLCGCGGAAAEWTEAQREEHNTPKSPPPGNTVDPSAANQRTDGNKATAQAVAPKRAVLYLNFEGVDLSPGKSNSIANTSSSIESAVKVRRFDHTRFAFQNPLASRSDAIRGIVKVVKEEFARFKIDITTDRPTRGPYTMVVIGGTSNEIVGKNVGGVAPLDCGNKNPNDVAFVFANTVPRWAGFPRMMVGLTIAHEAGHTYGLNHIRPHNAIMSPTLHDVLAPFNSWRTGKIIPIGSKKACPSTNGETQDSAALLEANLKRGHVSARSQHSHD